MFKNKTTNLIHWKRSSDVDFEYMLVLTKNTSENAHKQFHSGIIKARSRTRQSSRVGVGFGSDVLWRG